MERKHIPSGSPYEEAIGFSRAVRIGSIISISGTAPINPDGSTACPGNLFGQTRHCLGIIKKAIEEAGGSLDCVIRTRVMLKDISCWEEAARAHGEYFAPIKPACTFVEVKGFVDPGWLVEIEADCVLDGERQTGATEVSRKQSRLRKKGVKP
jgi:enamine deaminase RidA (YjgF/YER057c/UK114 family)